LPVTARPYGSFGNTRDIVVLYSCHLTALAGLNGILWLLAGLPRGQPSVAVGMAFTTTVFVLATLFVLIAQQTTLRNGCGVAPLRRRLSKDFSKGAGEVEQIDVSVTGPGTDVAPIESGRCWFLTEERRH
jgi:hypothetical protein